MRFLCLHGRGTNAQIFKNQTARIRENLGQDHEYVFINGNIRVKPWAGTRNGTALRDEGRGFWPFEDRDEDGCRAVYQDLRSFVELNGPFDALMAFSEGASVGATLIIESWRRHPERESTAGFRCAIFFCGLSPLELQLGHAGESVRLLDPAVDGVLMHVPTAHIWSSSGEMNPGMGKDLATLCDPESREELVHELGHDIPGARSDDHLRQALRVIDRTIERAKSCKL